MTIINRVARITGLACITLACYLLKGAFLTVPCNAASAAPPEKILTSQPTGGTLERIEGSNACARRIFKDSANRIVREIFYDAYPRTLDPGNLREVGTNLMEYDDAGRLVINASYNRDSILSGYSDHSYWPDDSPRLSHYFTAVGIRYREVRFPQKGGDKPTTLEFDQVTGKQLIYMSGPVPDDVDLADGWGPPTGVLRFGITLYEPPFISCTVKNSSGSTSPIAQDAIGKLIRPQLRDGHGQVVPYKKNAVKQLSSSQHAGPTTLPPNHASYEYYSLGDWYGTLPPGKYSLLIRRCATSSDFSLDSNTVQFVVDTPASVPPASGPSRP
jgi:hypothetical protein